MYFEEAAPYPLPKISILMLFPSQHKLDWYLKNELANLINVHHFAILDNYWPISCDRDFWILSNMK